MNSIFTEENLLAFTTAARFGSFSKAATELGLTTSAISYTIKRMETGLDVVLFTRSTRSIELTESGRYFFRKVVVAQESKSHGLFGFRFNLNTWPGKR